MNLAQGSGEKTGPSIGDIWDELHFRIEVKSTDRFPNLKYGQDATCLVIRNPCRIESNFVVG